MIPPNMPDDRQLIDGCLVGRPESWTQFVDRFSKLIYWSIHETLKDSSFSGRKDLPEDIFQDVFGRLIERNELAKLREVQSVRRFLNVMASHATLDRIKTLSRHEGKHTLIEAADWEPASTGSHAEKNEQATLVEEALSDLSAKERACVEMHYIHGRTHREIGLILGMPQDTASTIIRRSKEKIKEALKKRGYDGE